MRTLLLALLFAFIIMTTMLHAGAIKEEHEQRTKAKRYLLSESSSLGRKGIGKYTNDLSMKGSSSANTITNPADSGNNKIANKNGDNDNDDTNNSYQKYGNASEPGPSLNSHHFFRTRTPPIHR
ncbi:hypothetical protein Fmac_009597 [Flemingia macrophylla]|uniref:Uncharacterized protein n=1 Tax=Flemingia macrophylla TaxID=520843 RepID=A0ABD1N1K8_9FABA